MAARSEKVVSFTVTRTGKKYKADEIPKTIKDAVVEVEVSELDEHGVAQVLGTYETEGWSEDGLVYHIVPDDLGPQLEASQAARRASEKAAKADPEA